jgi:hypothetical protein
MIIPLCKPLCSPCHYRCNYSQAARISCSGSCPSRCQRSVQTGFALRTIRLSAIRLSYPANAFVGENDRRMIDKRMAEESEDCLEKMIHSVDPFRRTMNQTPSIFYPTSLTAILVTRLGRVAAAVLCGLLFKTKQTKTRTSARCDVGCSSCLRLFRSMFRPV